MSLRLQAFEVAEIPRRRDSAWSLVGKLTALLALACAGVAMLLTMRAP